ncbi:G1 family endopeptidase [Jatrophihabitans telluris]|uniref:G1 family endopeptidase n=1 Tax=Jatrophihabitans telluris TaxID=2038343 RepID=A0ABY4QYP8_9ACTN|nr:G1 family glutamic endopeptidase [Jatrophihabitans telluris]UQX88670.1 G1 family endopeptidase [Jatrophihabitans telluris]
MAANRTPARTRQSSKARAAERSTPVPQTLTAKGFQVRGFGPLPDTFDPMTASARQLAAQRLPRRPDANKEPQLRELWERAMGRTKVWITPEFEHREHISHGPMRQEPAPKRRGAAAATGATAAAEQAVVSNATSTNWSGAAVFSPADKPYRFVGGQWTVPSPNTVDDGSYYASEWVGIDGWGSPDVLQAGTETEVTKLWIFRSTQVYAWWEWYPAGEVRIGNLPVSPGDVMYCLICADSTSHATVTFSNQSSGVGTRFDITAPSGTTLTGNVAEWIVERPSVNGSVASLTDYAACYFDECIAGGSLHVDNIGAASLITMTGTGGAALSEPVKENDHVVKVNWRKSS